MAEAVLELGPPAHGGFCVARLDGRVVFTRYGMPGETVRAVVTEGEADARFWRAEAIEVIDHSSTDRVATPCPWFGPGLCGGCSWLHASADAQLRMKSQILIETLDRLGGVQWPQLEVRGLGVEKGWRIRVTLHVDASGRAGFHAARSNDLVPLTDCLQADPRLDLPELLQRDWPPGSSVHVSVSDAGRAVVVTDSKERVVTGPDEHRHCVLGRDFECGVDGFWQSHRDGANTLAACVVDLAGPARRVVDLYAGVGVLGLSLLEAGAQELLLIEGDRRAAEFAVRNAAGDPRVHVVRQDVKVWARRRPASSDVVVLDPPRAGAGRQVVAGIAATGADTVVYVSCEPSTLARDLKYFADHGFTPDHVEAFDLFPGTAHLETVVRLRG